MEGLTDRQRETLDYIRDTIATKGFPPSLREINAQFACASPSSAERALEALEAKGLIERDARIPRGIRLTEPKAVLPLGVKYYIVLNAPFHVTGLERIA